MVVGEYQSLITQNQFTNFTLPQLIIIMLILGIWRIVCDNGGGKLAGKLMPDVGTKEGNEQAREAAHTLIKQILTQ